MDKIRIDKWLWSVRIFKSRTMATDACKSGKVRLNLKPSKASSIVVVGDVIELKRGGFTFMFKVNQILKSRVSALLAAPAYSDLTPQEELNKYKQWFTGKSKHEYREKGIGRPTKRDRREISEYKDADFMFTGVEYNFDEEE